METSNPFTDQVQLLVAVLPSVAKQGSQIWQNFVIPEVEWLPAIQWKLLNIARMNPTKRKAAAVKLKKILFQRAKSKL